MKYKEKRAILAKLEKKIERELAYDYKDYLPDKYSLNKNLVSGDEYAKNMVLDTYKSINTLYGLFTPSAMSLGIKIFVMSVIGLMFLAGLVITFVFWSDAGLIFTLACLGFGCIVYRLMFYSRKMYVYMYKEKGKNIIIYKDTKEDTYIVYMNKKQIYRYEDEEWHQIKKANHMGGRLLFQHVCGELMVKKHRRDIVEIYCRNRAPFEIHFRCYYQISAQFFIKKGKPWRINYYPAYLPDNGRVRGANSEQLEILEINTDRVAEVPISFLKFCEDNGIEPLKENEHLRYVDVLKNIV